MPLVPNQFPRINPTYYKLAVIGECPGEQEEQMGIPFVGPAGNFLRAKLASTGMVEAQLFFGNICQSRPPRNELSNLSFDGPEIAHGLAQLTADLSTFRPNCLLLLGRATLRAFKPSICYDTKRGYQVPLDNWRGSIFRTDAHFDCKAVATYHPSYLLRAYSDVPYFRFDLARARTQSAFPEVRVKERFGNITPTLQDVISFIRGVRTNGLPIAFDIEGYANATGVTMISLCPTPTSGIVIPFWSNGNHYWSETEEVIIWRELSGLLADPTIQKSAHNGFYELFVLAWRHKLLVNHLTEDTMIKGWECQPELERSLAVNTSIYTEEPYYKDDRESPDPTVKLQYNFKDSAVTAEICTAQEQVLAKYPESLTHYHFNMSCVYPTTYMMLRGCKLDHVKLFELKTSTEADLIPLQTAIDDELLVPALAADVLTRKRKSDPWHFNVKSNDQKKWFLYQHLGLTPSRRWGEVADEDTLLDYWKKSQNPLLRLVIRAVRKRTRLSDIDKLVPNDDGRIRSSYDLVGTDTGRSSSRASQALRIVHSKTGIPSWEETGTNLQNQTKELRVVFTSDSSDYDFWQYDLSGADGWTVAADLAALGHSTMLDDYLYGIKPALVLLVMLQEYEAGRNPAAINQLDRPALKLLCKAVKSTLDENEGKKDSHGRPADWQYLCCKRVQHGSNYGARPETISELIFGDSDGEISLSPKEAGLYQYFYKLRYKTDTRNEHIRKQLSDKGYLVAACGIRRVFHGIRNRRDIDDDILRKASSFEPQANTTYITNKALANLWYDPENRTSRNTLFVEPLLQIHDALAGQFKHKNLDWSAKKLNTWFCNPLIIHGIKVTIPADGKYGPNWKDTKLPLNDV